jgi:hypothetical protein
MASNTKQICWEHKKANDLTASKLLKKKKVLSKERQTDVKLCSQMKMHSSQAI